MKNLISVLTFIAILIAVSSNLAICADKKLELTDKQENFAKKISNDSEFSKAEWINNYVLDATLEPSWSILITETDAKKQAAILATQGFLYTGKNICFRITDPNRGELAYECKGDQSES